MGLIFNSLGTKVEHLESSNICLLNDKSPTYFHPASGLFSSIDLSLYCICFFLILHDRSILIIVVVTTFIFLLIQLKVCLTTMFLAGIGIFKKLIGQNLNFSVLYVLIGIILPILLLFIYLFGVLCRFQHCTGHITMGNRKGRGNQYIQSIRVLYCKLLTNCKQLPAFPLEAVPGIEPQTQRWEARVLPLCHRGPFY